MSKSKLKPEDIFFSMQKTHEAKNRAFEEAKKQAEDAEVEKVLEEAKKQAGAAEPEEIAAEREAPEAPKKSPAKKPENPKKSASTGKKRGPVADPENAKRVPINVKVPVEVKYGATALINEMKMKGIKESYNLTDFVLEAIEEKIKRTKKQLDLE